MPPPTLRVHNRNTCYRGSRRGSAALDAELDGVYGELVVVLVALWVEVCLDNLGRLLAGDAGYAPDLEYRHAGRYLKQVRHILRGGSPCAFDRELATRFGVKAVELIAEGKFGHVAALEAGKLVAKPIEKAVKKLKLVDPQGELVRTAKGVGIELGG